MQIWLSQYGMRQVRTKYRCRHCLVTLLTAYFSSRQAAKSRFALNHWRSLADTESPAFARHASIVAFLLASSTRLSVEIPLFYRRAGIVCLVVKALLVWEEVPQGTLCLPRRPCQARVRLTLRSSAILANKPLYGWICKQCPSPTVLMHSRPFTTKSCVIVGVIIYRIVAIWAPLFFRTAHRSTPTFDLVLAS